MSVKLKALQAVAGTTAANAGGAINVEDVFSTYLYTGNNDNSKSQGINNNIALGNFGVGSSTRFDGVTAYPIERSGSALTGTSSGSKTFTYSGWIQLNKNPITSWSTISFNGFFFHIYGNENQLLFIGRNSSGTNIFYGEVNGANPRLFNNGEWFHILISADLTNSSNRHVYINDVSQTVAWNTYTNDTIAFGQTTVTIGNRSTGGYNFDHNQAHLYLDFTYRDLSIASNRRIFIDADGGSTSESSLIALNPIIYLPMTSEYEIGVNQGTGGDFTNNGGTTIDTTIGTEYDSTAGQGGLVWVKGRDQARENVLQDTERGTGVWMRSNDVNGNLSNSQYVTAFNSNGFIVGAESDVNFNGEDYASWTFRKAPKFFDIVTYTGTGSPQTISHNLGSAPGFYIVKATSQGSHWAVYHNGTGTQRLRLNTTEAADESGFWATAPTSTDFSVSNPDVNTLGSTYIAYLFAHNDGDGGFGPDGDADIIKCGSYTGNGSTDGPEIDLGFEPQWLMIKSSSLSENWHIFDNMRGVATGGDDSVLYPNLSSVESTSSNWLSFTPTGFKITATFDQVNNNTNTYIYMAIRRGPMAVPTDATDVFGIDYQSPGEGSDTFISTGFTVDTTLYTKLGGSPKVIGDRLRGTSGGGDLITTDTSAEASNAGAFFLDHNDGVTVDFAGGHWNAAPAATDEDYIRYFFSRAPNFFDVVTYTGNGVQGRNITHNLGVTPDMIWVKNRTDSVDWAVYVSGITHLSVFGSDPDNYGDNPVRLELNTTEQAQFSSSGAWDHTHPTDTVFRVGDTNATNGTGDSLIAYLFASLDGVSKVGSFTSTGSDVNVDCGFTNGARFVLIKRTNSTDDWFVFDAERGIVTGNDGRLKLNNTTAEALADNIDPYPAGFTMTSGILGAAGNTFIFYAIA